MQYVKRTENMNGFVPTHKLNKLHQLTEYVYAYSAFK